MLGLRTIWDLLLLALALGLLGNHLLRAPVWGLNVALGLTAMAAAAFAVSLRPALDRFACADRTNGKDRSTTVRWPWLAAAFFAAMWAVRDSEPLLAMDLLAALALACLPLIRGGNSGLRTAGVVDLVAAAIGTAWRTVTGGADLLRNIGSIPVAWRTVATVGVGLLLAIPAVLIFGALFASADPLFNKMVSSLVGVRFESILSHLLLTVVLTWLAAGYLWTHAAPRPFALPSLPVIRLGQVQVMMILGATGLVFALFVGVQASSLFGGEAFVRNQTGLTYAEYARRGFFQMIVAAGLSLPLVYGAAFAAGPAEGRSANWLRALMAAQLGLTVLVLASAVWRLGLYVRAYGLTEDRLYGGAVLLWIAVVVMVFVPTVLRGRPAGVVLGTIVAAVVVLGVLNLVNPAALVARYNLSHQERRAADVKYLARLGADAVPVLVDKLEEVAPEGRCELAATLVRRYGALPGDWRGWNLARWRAQRSVARLRSFLTSCLEK
ncbi:MAG: DUF4173 domain-containing protein [Blastocatellia bacterium]|nr:DUF4173 domain-containing protein [Blastocatellia bacterium]MCS7157266.1 DUF4173 domain-containing protein [Blastocatellia bacterium]MCX7752046.1 DUF4173 domain-containing protein [Blastocatellia bacterium]MDW8167151.1 DUF4173 domain-containing protein [Acidobacteriota bacterium]MDW8257526.1 DUF4173 domain-containing protein [Acidobacteriota bacterium]